MFFSFVPLRLFLFLLILLLLYIVLILSIVYNIYNIHYMSFNDCSVIFQVFSPLPEVQEAARLPSIIGAVLQIINGVVFIGEGAFVSCSFHR